MRTEEHKRVAVAIRIDELRSGVGSGDGEMSDRRIQYVDIAPNVRNRKVLRVARKRGLPLNDAAPFA